MAAGAIAGVIAGPFGIPANIILGSSIGYLSTSQKFHDFVFGNKEKNIDGLVQRINKNIFKNIEDIFKNTGSTIKGLLKVGINEIKNKSKEIFEDIRKKSMNILFDNKLVNYGKNQNNTCYNKFVSKKNRQRD